MKFGTYPGMVDALTVASDPQLDISQITPELIEQSQQAFTQLLDLVVNCEGVLAGKAAEAGHEPRRAQINVPILGFKVQIEVPDNPESIAKDIAHFRETAAGCDAVSIGALLGHPLFSEWADALNTARRMIPEIGSIFRQPELAPIVQGLDIALGRDGGMSPA